MRHHNGAMDRLRSMGLQLVKEGKNDRQIAKIVGCNKSLVCKWRMLNQIPAVPQFGYSPLLNTIGWVMYREGCSDAQIAAKVGCSRTNVRLWRKVRELPSNCPVGSEDWRSTLSTKAQEETISLVHAGYTDKEAAEMLGIDYQAFSARRRRLGLKHNKPRTGSRSKKLRNNEDGS